MSLNWNCRGIAHIGWSICISSLFVLCATGLVSEASGQVVQLPSQRQFSVQTTVDVPDGGTVGLGGAGYSASSSVSRGLLFPNRAIGVSAGAHVTSVTAQIIDLAAMDEAILSGNNGTASRSQQPERFRSRQATESDMARQFISDYRTLTQPDKSIDYRDWSRTLRSGAASQAVDSSLVGENVRHFLKKADEAEKLNRIQASRVYYRMAWEAMTPEMKQRYQQFLADRARWNQEQQAAEQPGKRKF